MLKREIHASEVYIETTSSDDEDIAQRKINLNDDDPFEENDSVVVLSIDEFNSIINKSKQKDEEIKDLNNQIETFKNSFFDEVIELKDSSNDKEKLLEANEKISKLNDKLIKVEEERVAIFKELDYKNKMILAYNVELNKSILNAINVVIDEARDNINKKNKELIERLDASIAKAKHEVNEKNKAIAFEISSTVDAMNEEIKKTSMLKMLLNKNKINLHVSTEDLLKPFNFDVDINDLLTSQALELDASEILKEVMPKLPEPFSKYIDTLDDGDEEENIKTIDVETK